jgi:hypothetical protein
MRLFAGWRELDTITGLPPMLIIFSFVGFVFGGLPVRIRAIICIASGLGIS